MLIFTKQNLKETDRINLETGRLDVYDVRDKHLKTSDRARLAQAKHQKRPALFKTDNKTKILLYY